MTADHIHDIPGRLRIRVPALKRNHQMAARTEGAFKRVSGVASVQANPLTGSVLVHYNTRATDASAILSAAGVNRALPSYRRVGSVKAASRDNTVLTDKIVKAVLWYTLEKVVERSVPLLLAAIL